MAEGKQKGEAEAAASAARGGAEGEEGTDVAERAALRKATDTAVEMRGDVVAAAESVRPDEPTAAVAADAADAGRKYDAEGEEEEMDSGCGEEAEAGRDN